MRHAARALLLPLLIAATAHAQKTLPATPAPVPASATDAAPPELKVARASVIAYVGYIEVERKTTGAREAVVRAPMGLAPGDLVRTGSGRATVQFRDGSRVALDPGAAFIVEAETLRETSIFLSAGKLWAAVSKSAARRFAVRTPSAVAAVRGTEFSVEVAGKARTAVEVFGGLVSVRDTLGGEAMVSARERVDVAEGRAGRVERFQPRSESVPPAMRPALLGPAGDGKATPGEGRDPRGAQEGPREGGPGEPGRGPKFGFDPSRFKDFVERQAGEQLQRDQRESQSIFEHKAQLYQEGKTLIDAFGRRVRVEEHILRPSADSFRFVSLNFRDNRTDLASVEVTANQTLPQRLSDAGNLWFSQGNPTYWAVKQRLTMTNGVDSVVQVGVDGAPQMFSFPGGPVFDPGTGNFINSPGGSFYRTMFGNKYEFINGNAAAIADVYHGSFRPVQNGAVSGAGNAASGLMWRTQPVKVDITDGATSRGLYWTDAFVTYNANDGLAFAQTTFQPEPGEAHFVSQRSYFNFRDTNANGLLDFGEQTTPDDPVFFHDVVNRMNGTSLTAVAGAGTRQTAGDTLVFSDLNATGAPAGNPQQVISYPGTPLDTARAFAQANPRDWLRADEFAIDDFGLILPAGNSFNGSVNLFNGANFERRLRSTRFTRPDIDVVMSPSFIFQSGVSEAAHQDRPIPSPGPKF